MVAKVDERSQILQGWPRCQCPPVQGRWRLDVRGGSRSLAGQLLVGPGERVVAPAGPPARANSQGVIAALRAREIELGFVETPTIPRDLVSRQVAADRLVLVVAPDQLLARRHRPVSRDELAAMQLVSREDGSGTRDSLHVAVGQAMVPPAVELDSNAAVKVLVSSGSYPAVISELAVSNELRDGRLVEVPLGDVDLSRSLNAVWRRGTRLRSAAGHFLLTARPIAGPPRGDPSR